MGFLKKTKRKQTEATLLRRLSGKNVPSQSFLEGRRILAGLIFFAFTILLVLICFVGLSPAGPQILPNQIARIRVVADFPFSYKSEILTGQLIEQRRERVPPVYRLKFDPYRKFEQSIEALNESLVELEEKTRKAPAMEKETIIKNFLTALKERNSFTLSLDDLSVLLDEVEPKRRLEILRDGLKILREIYEVGVYDSEHAEIRAETGELSFFNIQKGSGNISHAEVQSKEDALRVLRINLSAFDISRDLSVTLYRILRQGLQPNLVFDQEKSEAKIAQVVAQVNPIVIRVKEGQTIIEPETKVTPLDIERLTAYRLQLKLGSDFSKAFNSLFMERLLMTAAVLFAAAVFMKIRRFSPRGERRRIILSGLVILIHLSIIRMIIEWGEGNFLGNANYDLIAVLPYLAPLALGPIIIAILLGQQPGIYVAFLVSIFNALMQGGSIPIFLVAFLSSLVGIYFCRDVHLRKKVVRAGAMAGLCVAVFALFLGLRDVLDARIIGEQILVSLIVGVVTGIAVVGFLPILEHLFKLTTNISLLELTDFNHPLLRKMQVAAPGTYHHSLMVANLSENAAAEIGSNPQVCRVCSLFHDIGKIIKPEYFTENQRQGINPHLKQNPSMSALVIKSHIKEGVALARQFKLPDIVIDVIRQHHGTTLIQYFYYKALRQKEKETTPPLFPDAPRIEIDRVNESTYRYTGPKPQFKESAIIFFADSVEAASRSLRKVTPQAIDDLLDRIFQERLDDKQLSECPLNFNEVTKIKKCFSLTLLTMLHARVEYPSRKARQKAEREAAPKGRGKSLRKEKKSTPAALQKPFSTAPKPVPEKEIHYAEIKEGASPHSDNKPG